MFKKHCLLVLLILLTVIGCKKSLLSIDDVKLPTQNENIPKDTLRIVTQYSATSYFTNIDEELGYDYEMIKNFAQHLHLPLKITVAQSDDEMYNLLEKGEVDIAAYNTFETKELKTKFTYVFPQQESYLVVVQHINKNAVSEPLELKGKEVWVKENSIHHQRLKSLNDEIGGGIIIKFASDSLTSDDLTQQVSSKKIQYTIAYRHKALLQKNFDGSLDIRIPIGFNQKNGWLLRKQSKALTNSVQSWLAQSATINLADRLFDKYWDKNPYFSSKNIHVPKGNISPYDDIFKKYAQKIGWDWRLLAAVAYAESEFDKNAHSWAGARGLMQLMPQTGMEFGLNANNFTNPESNIEAGVEYIKSLNMIYRKVEDKEERIKFILASYNSGPAHILDAIALTEKYGKNKRIWFNHVEYYLSKKNDPQFYNDPACKYGKFRGKETLRYVPFVLDTYQRYCNKSKK